MQGWFAFTAEYWGDAAVVCRATEDRPGPSVQQEFGKFATWTQENAFAAGLNEGLEIDPAEADRIITGSILDTSEVLREADFPAHECDPVRWLISGNRLRVEFMLAKLDLAVTFCRIARSGPSEHTNRLLRNARNALFDGMHFVCGSELAAYESEAIAERLTKLHAEFEQYSPQS
jgi:hypothetical protein